MGTFSTRRAKKKNEAQCGPTSHCSGRRFAPPLYGKAFAALTYRLKRTGRASQLIRSLQHTTGVGKVGTIRDCWAQIQMDVASCVRCGAALPEVGVECPPGPLYPLGIEPPDPVRVLFVGVAPPENGCHFYTDPSDN